MRINIPAIGMKKISIAIIIEVGKTATPAPAAFAYSRDLRDIGKVTLAIVLVKTIASSRALDRSPAFAEDAGNEPI